jgi:hypothetical protein
LFARGRRAPTCDRDGTQCAMPAGGRSETSTMPIRAAAEHARAFGQRGDRAAALVQNLPVRHLKGRRQSGHRRSIGNAQAPLP